MREGKFRIWTLESAGAEEKDLKNLSLQGKGGGRIGSFLFKMLEDSGTGSLDGAEEWFLRGLGEKRVSGSNGEVFT